MENFETLLKTTLAEIEKVLTTKTVVGDPISVEGTTIIPLISVGFGFGGGGGTGKSQKSDAGSGTGLGGGGGAKPVAVIIVGKDGEVRVEPIKGSRIAEGLSKIISRAMEKKSEPKSAA